MPPRRKNWNGIAPPPTGLRRWALRVCSCGPAVLSEIYEGTPRAFVIGVSWPSKHLLCVAKPGSALHHRRPGSVAGSCECARVVRPCSLKSMSARRGGAKLPLRLDFRVASLGTHETAVSQGPSMGGCEFYGDTTRFGLCGTHSLDHPGHKGRERIKADPRTGKGCIVSQTHMRFMRMLAWERSTRSPCCRE